MKCQAVVRQLSLYLEDDLPAVQREEMARHLEGCAACRAEIEFLRVAERALQSLTATEAAPELLADLRRRLAGPPARSGRWAWAGGLAAAAAVAALLMWPRAEEKRVVSPVPKPVAPRVEETRPAPPVVAGAPGPVTKPTPVRAVRREGKRLASRPRLDRGRKLQACATAGFGDPALQASAAPATSGIILILGDPIPPLTESRCRLELTLADGTRSVYERNTEAGEGGRPGTVAITYEQSAPEMTSDN